MNLTIYILNGKKHSKAELLELADNKIIDKQIPQWEKDVFQFILEWFNNSNSIIAQTSGSTGTPKEISLPKVKMAKSASMTAEYFSLHTGSKVALLLPANYIAGKMMIVRALVNQWDLYLGNPKGNVLEQLPEIEFDFTAMVPLQAENTLENPAHWKKIKKCILGGAPVSDTLKKELQKLPTTFYESYGMTETMSHVAIKNISKNQACFEAISGMKFMQDDRNCLKIVAPDLLDKPLQSNDIVDLKDEKHFRWLGRFDNVINSGGVKLMPEQIEAKLKTHIPYEFFISSEPDKKLGEKVILIVEANKANLRKIKFDSIFEQYLDSYEKPKTIYNLAKFKRS
ncbi:MAG: AMP-binding protein, partial [Chitinophagales bacterium]